jgi:hypothetical protein
VELGEEVESLEPHPCNCDVTIREAPCRQVNTIPFVLVIEITRSIEVFRDFAE